MTFMSIVRNLDLTHTHTNTHMHNTNNNTNNNTAICYDQGKQIKVIKTNQSDDIDVNRQRWLIYQTMQPESCMPLCCQQLTMSVSTMQPANFMQVCCQQSTISISYLATCRGPRLDWLVKLSDVDRPFAQRPSSPPF
jgi:hypothetical protein